MEQIQNGFDSSVTERFVPLPYPRKIDVAVKDPRLKQLNSSNMLNMTVELIIEWDHSLSDKITSYEIYTTSSFPCAYDRFRERAGTVVDGSLTKFSQTFSALLADQNTPMLVLVTISTECNSYPMPHCVTSSCTLTVMVTIILCKFYVHV